MSTMLRIGSYPNLNDALRGLAKGPPLPPGSNSERDQHWKVLLEAIDRALCAPEAKEYALAHPELPEELRHHFRAIDRREIDRLQTVL